MAGALGFEPRNYLIQSQAPYQLGHAPASEDGHKSSRGRRLQRLIPDRPDQLLKPGGRRTSPLVVGT